MASIFDYLFKEIEESHPDLRVSEEQFNSADLGVIDFVFVDDISHSNNERLVTKVGELIFLNAELIQSLEIPRRYANVILLPSQFSHLITPQNMRYTALTSAILAYNVDVSHKKTIDFGCGDGIQSIIALRKGAKKVIGIDFDWKCESRARNLMNINQVLGFSFVHIDITDLDQIHRMFDPYSDNAADVAICNIGYGYHKLSKSDPVMCSLALSANIPTIKTIVGGGIHDGGIYDAKPIFDFLKAEGFTIDTYLTENPSTYINKIERPRLSYVATRS